MCQLPAPSPAPEAQQPQKRPCADACAADVAGAQAILKPPTPLRSGSSSRSSSVSTCCSTPRQNQTVTILDWDDTLLPTSHIYLQQEAPEEGAVPEALKAGLKGVEASARRILEQSLARGEVYIITNAAGDWVEHSAAKYLPELLPLLERVRVVSARGRFERELPGRPEAWKERAFLEVQGSLDASRVTNLIALGDCKHDLDAARALGRALGWEPAQEAATPLASPTGARGGSSKPVLVKTVKFQQSPSVEDLRKQLELVAKRFEQIVRGPKDLEIGLERRWAGAAAPAAPARTTQA